MGKLFRKMDRFMDNVCAPKWRAIRNIICLLLSLTMMYAMYLLFYAPICQSEGGEFTIVAIEAFQSLITDNLWIRSFALMELAAFVFLVICMLINLLMIFSQLGHLADDERKIRRATKRSVIYSTVIIATYTAFTYILTPINIMTGGYSEANVYYTPLIIAASVVVLYAILVGIPESHRRRRLYENGIDLDENADEHLRYRKRQFKFQLVSLIFAILMAVVAVLALMCNIVTVKFVPGDVAIPDMVISGWGMIKGTAPLTTSGERMVAFGILLMSYTVLTLLLLSIVSFIGRSNYCNKVMIGSIIASSGVCASVGMFSMYYKVGQQLSVETIEMLLKKYSIESESMLKYTIDSDSGLFCYILLGLLSLLFLIKPLSKAQEEYNKRSSYEMAVAASAVSLSSESPAVATGAVAGTEVAAEAGAPVAAAAGEGVSNDLSIDRELFGDERVEEDEETEVETEDVEPEPEPEPEPPKPKDFDPCPAFTEIDKKLPIFEEELERKRESLYAEPTLPNLVSYIVQYARDSRHHLIYSEESIAAFLAGLGSTKLTILQGMSGTGKTSLPKIVAEALMSVCDIVEIESSWRDKNELLGYYNEFSSVYTPKKFTQVLYKACLNPDTLTFIVLDEMNLSRIEYYFSDFLSLMENEPDQRAIKLLNTQLSRVEEGERYEYVALTDGHTIRIPQNVWFIGTANRDESTYDISDKVYDRAHTMNFDKRAQKPASFGEPIPARYLPVGELVRMFDEAKASAAINIDNFPVIHEAEELLEPYNISFGNRIAMHIEAFVGIYSSCFEASEEAVNDAIDIILLSKVVKKLELKSVDDKETLAGEFEKIGLKRCSAFVMGLRED